MLLASLTTDASDTHVGGVLQQLAAGKWQPLAFYSKKLSGVGTGTHLRQRAAGHFQHGPTLPVSAGRAKFLPSHRPQTTGHCPVPPWSAYQQQHLSFIAIFSLDIRHTPGQENVVADTLSHPPAPQGPPADTQPKPALLPTSFTSVTEDWLEEGLAAQDRPVLATIAIAQLVGGAFLIGDVSTGMFRLLGPIQSREAVFQSLHSINHPGVGAGNTTPHGQGMLVFPTW
jgi:hypothetical protein